jgi:hypothetical protein
MLVTSLTHAQDSPSDTPSQSEKQVSGQIDLEWDSEKRRSVLPQVENGTFILPKLSATSTATDNVGTGRIPDGLHADSPRQLQVLPEDGYARGLTGGASVCTWAAANTYSLPRYFEDRLLERHGHERLPCLQPMVSGARFFATMPALPYLFTVRHPCECEYTVGYYRPGSCAPVMLQRPPCERKAGVVQGAAIAAAIIAFP